MFIGHFALAFAARPLVPRASLGSLVLAAQWLDLVWPTLLLAGVERVVIDPGLPGLTPLAFVHYPYTHSLLAALLWAVLAGGLAWSVGAGRRHAAVVAALVASHWLLDALVHRPDLPLAPGGEARLGLGLWQQQPALAVTLELLLFAGAAWLYLCRAAPPTRVARLGAWALLATLLAIFAANLFGPPPPSVQAIAWAGQAQWLFVLWAWAIDRDRGARLQAA